MPPRSSAAPAHLVRAPRWARSVLAVFTSWWFVGIAGWLIVAWNYPVDTVLPRYAGDVQGGAEADDGDGFSRDAAGEEE